ncbi:MAG TPA: globin domain-containing protein [Blastocatellia bacterium]|nr:globin domain-containing protein [Blastocatellia bacterium]
MTLRQTELVRSSFAEVAELADAAGIVFFGRLFEIDPALRPLFKGDLQQHWSKAMEMLGLVVSWIDWPELLLPALKSLGRRHAGYGVKDQHYLIFADALIFTLKVGLGDTFTSEVEDAWIEAYQMISNAMRKAAPVAAVV